MCLTMELKLSKKRKDSSRVWATEKVLHSLDWDILVIVHPGDPRGREEDKGEIVSKWS